MKIVKSLLALSLVACFIGCSKKDNPTPENTTETAETTQETQVEKLTYIFDNEVIVDNEYCTITIVNVNETKRNVDFKFNLENKTEDTNLMFSIDNVAANNWMLPTLFADSVAPGKKSIETLELMNIGDYNLTSIDKLEFSLRVYDYDDWMADDFVNEVMILYPTGLSEDEVISPEISLPGTETVLVDNDYCSIIILEDYTDKLWGYTLSTYIENKTTDMDMLFSVDDVSVNGYMVDPFWATSVTAGNKKLSGISFSDSQFKENGIENVENVEFELIAHGIEDWRNNIVQEVFTYTPLH